MSRSPWPLVLLALLPAAPSASSAEPDPCAALPLPSKTPYVAYEERLAAFLDARCYIKLGWKTDKGVRDTGPFIATEDGASWSGALFGTHPAVLIVYSPEVVAWARAREASPDKPPSIPDGAIIVKEMYAPPASRYAGLDPASLTPSEWTVMVKDASGSRDGWFWGYYGADGWAPDWPPPANFPYPNMGFGLYCVNCHASAEAESTFTTLRNMEGEPGHPITYLSQYLPETVPARASQQDESHHAIITAAKDDVDRVSTPRYRYDPAFTALYQSPLLTAPTWADVAAMALPPEPYDHVVAGPDGPGHFLTSDQCLGCHDAGSTGLRYDMTIQPASGGPLVDLSPYAEWRASPMGLGGRDPIFLAQLESELTYYPTHSKALQDTCLHCHGVMGQRSLCMDQVEDDALCDTPPDLFDPPADRQLFSRAMLDAIPYQPPGQEDPEEVAQSHYGGLARDGISCTTCHHVAEPTGAPADTFTGGFALGPKDEVIGPFEAPRTLPMDHALGLKPVASDFVKRSELCGSCHTVALPVLRSDGSPVLDRSGQPKTVYEQATYPEWAMSAYRDGGSRAQTCQDCHMRSAYPDKDGELAFKIASIEESTVFPEADFRAGPDQIDLPVRPGYARHTLLGMNLFFIKLAQQFPDVLGIRTSSPMMASAGVAPLLTAERALESIADDETAELSVGAVSFDAEALSAEVRVTSQVGHKFPSGVGFRRAFLHFEVLDARGAVLWASGRSTDQGVIVDQAGQPVAGELWWTPACGERQPTAFQPHYTVISQQDQAQIYQELATNPEGQLTTSFLAIDRHLKDNRILPAGWDPSPRIARVLGDPRLATEILPDGVGKDKDYNPGAGGGDTLLYRVPRAALTGVPAKVRATLYYQSIPPFYLQDRFCTAPKGQDTSRLYFLTGHLDLKGSRAEGWKLAVVASEAVDVPRGL